MYGGGYSPWWLAASGEDTILPIRGRRRGRFGVARNNFSFPWPLEPYLKAAMGALNPRRWMRARLRDPGGAWLPPHRGLRTDYVTSVNKGRCGGAGPKLVTGTLAAAVAEALDAL